MRSDQQAAQDLISPLTDAIWDALHDAWEATEDPSIIGTIMSLVMTRFLEEYVVASGMDPTKRKDFYEKSLATHCTAIRRALQIRERMQ